MGAEFSDVALPFGETEEDARAGRNETGHWPFCSCDVNHGVGLGSAMLCYCRLSCSLRAMKAFLWPRMFDALFARVLMSTLLRQILRFLCPHRFSCRTAAFMARIIRCASVAARRSNMTRSACAEPGTWFCLPAR